MTPAIAHLLTLLMLTPGLTGSAPDLLWGSVAAAHGPVAPRPAPPFASDRTPGHQGAVTGVPRPSVVPGSVAARAPGSAAPAAGVWPLSPRPEVVAPFDPPLTRYGSGHRGVDLAGQAGQKVRVAVAGRVTFAGSLAGRGVLVVAHGATRTTYEPVRAAVHVGALVGAGQVIGTLQPFASHCAPAACLHWGLIEGETYVDPLILVGRGPVRLLPLSGVRTGRLASTGAS